MKTQQIPRIHQLFLEQLKLEHNKKEILNEFKEYHNPAEVSISEFIQLLTETGQSISLNYILNRIPKSDFARFLNKAEFPFLFFLNKGEEQVTMFHYFNETKKETGAFELTDLEDIKGKYWSKDDLQLNVSKLFSPESNIGHEEEQVLIITTYFAQTTLEEEYKLRPHVGIKEKITALRRLFDMLALERTEIGHLYIYAIITGLISLSLPLGIQSIMGFVTSGQVTTSVIILIIFILIGTLIAGGLNVIQLSLVEQMQRRIMARTAFTFAFRIPKLDLKYLDGKYYPPELINRFFDVPTVQKGIAKLLLDFTAALLQIFFGLLLLSFYHPYFIFLGVVLIAILVFIFALTGPQGLKSSLRESDYKYKIVAWFEELAKSLSTFKASGYSRLTTDRTDDYLSGYLFAREQHFRVLITQYFSFVAFKTIVTGGLLILGAVLVINQQINIGQFVASEIIIILIISSVEKIMGNLEVVYDVLTGITKIAKVTELPIKIEKGINFSDRFEQTGVRIEVKKLHFKHSGNPDFALKGIDLNIEHGESLCITGNNSSGKSTLAKIILGYTDSFDGVISYDYVSLREYNKNALFKRTGDNLIRESIFEGSFLENITMGDEFVPVQQVFDAVSAVGLKDYIDQLKEGINTKIIGGRLWLSDTICDKLILARAIVKQPELLVIDDSKLSFNLNERIQIIRKLSEQKDKWTFILLSKEPRVINLFNRVVLLDSGQISYDGHPRNMNFQDEAFNHF
jgi:ABC-type bacteriocin/lantibiotic exporter with double-glycine peptidase domain